MKVLLAIALLAVAWVVFCLADLRRAKQVRYLPKWGWAILCLGIGLTIPWGGLLYFAIGKVRSPAPTGRGQDPVGGHLPPSAPPGPA